MVLGDARKLLADAGLVGLGIQLTLGLALGLARPHSETIAAVFPPWWPPARALAAAAGAGRVVALGGAPGTVVVHGDARDLADRLRGAGAVFLIDAHFQVGCHPATPEISG